IHERHWRRERGSRQSDPGAGSDLEGDGVRDAVAHGYHRGRVDLKVDYRGFVGLCCGQCGEAHHDGKNGREGQAHYAILLCATRARKYAIRGLMYETSVRSATSSTPRAAS